MRAAQRFRAFLHALNKLTARNDAEGQAQRNAAEGDAAKVGLRLEEQESKGRPKQNHAEDNVGRAD